MIRYGLLDSTPSMKELGMSGFPLPTSSPSIGAVARNMARHKRMTELEGIRQARLDGAERRAGVDRLREQVHTHRLTGLLRAHRMPSTLSV
jgi:hypothetical protein